MTSQHENHATHDGSGPWWRNRGTLALLGFLAVAGYFLVTEHTAHLVGALPWLLLLACPVMHLFMHHGHGGHGHDHGNEPPKDAEREGADASRRGRP